jgi:F-type H+-transporting ATPase subunit epsilon
MAEGTPGCLRLVIVTPQGSVVKTEVTDLVAPGTAGEFGVLPGHIPFLSSMDAGVVTYHASGTSSVLAVGPGLVQVGANDEVIVLTETSAAPDQIDLNAVVEEERAATVKLAGLSPEDQAGDYAHTQAALKWARARREAAERQRASSSN